MQHTPIPASASVFYLTLIIFIAKDTDKDLQRVSSLFLNLFFQGQKQAQAILVAPELQNKSVKARFPD